MVDRSTVREWCRTGMLPDSNAFFAALTDETGRFTDVEGQNWDFKDQWPLSHSDSYFGGICRLICAFSNSEGGVIVFGVDDKSRIGGKNKVKPNLDRLTQAFTQLTSSKFEYDFRSYLPDEAGSVDVILIKPRQRHTN